MIDLIYKIYFFKFKNPFWDKIHTRILIRMANCFFPFYFSFSEKKKHVINSYQKREDLLIVSLTTFPKRINKVWLTIETILRQKEKPDKMILWLYEGEFNGKRSLPKTLLNQEKRGLEIRFCNKNLMPHKKYYYTMHEYPQATVITIDDDWFYPSNLIQKLKIFHKTYPNAIICPYTRKIEIQKNAIQPYKTWKRVTINTEPSFLNLTMGGGGTLFPPNSLHSDVFNIEAIIKHSLTADDLWLKIMSLKKNTRVVSIGEEFPRFFIFQIFKNNKSLININIGEGQNDYILQNLINLYKIQPKQFIDN